VTDAEEALRRLSNRTGYFDRNGFPMTGSDWAAKLEDDSYRRVAFDRVGSLEVSTVWLGLDHAHGIGPPLIFETMVFDEDGGSSGGYCERYTALAEAMAGHARVVAALLAEV
jgi:hypothetical protein